MNTKSEYDMIFMTRALELADKMRGKTRPNPTVGCVIVREGKIIGEGFHRGAGQPHAEIEALRACGNISPRSATCYVTLEPCSHTGRTPPCTDALIAAGIERVVIAMKDPNPHVPGGGAELLSQAGIQVEIGMGGEEARRINAPWIKWVTSGQPFVLLKSAASLDGKVASASGQSRWISGKSSRKHAHELRTRIAAIMVGRGTIAADDPQLTARADGVVTAAPLRIVLDSHLSLPVHHKVFQPDLPGNTLVATTNDCDKNKRELLEKLGVEVVAFDSDRGTVNLKSLMRFLGRRGIDFILAEGGPTLAFSLLRDRLVDRMLVYQSPLILGGNTARSMIGGEGFPELESAPRFISERRETAGEDFILEGRVAYFQGYADDESN